MFDGKIPITIRDNFGSNIPKGYREHMPKRFNFVIDDTWAKNHPDKILTRVHKANPEFTKKGKHTYRVHCGPELSDDMGLFVHTVQEAGPAHFAVATVLDGCENRDDFSVGNSLQAPLACKVENPGAVLQAVYSRAGRLGPGQMREYVYWEGGDGRLHNTPSSPIVLTYGVPGALMEAVDGKHRGDPGKLWLYQQLSVAGYGNNYAQNQTGSGRIRTDTRHVPPTRNAPLPTYRVPGVVGWRDGYARWMHMTRKQPEIPSTYADQRWGATKTGEWASFQPKSAPDFVFGYVDTWDTGDDPRKATVVPYIENRALFEIDFILREFPKLSPDRVVASGESGDGMQLAVHHADKFASAAVTGAAPWPAERVKGSRALFAGLAEWDLKTPDGYNVWDWNDLIWFSKKFPDKEWPFISHLVSPNYDGQGRWNNFGYPDFYLDLQKEKRSGAWWWCDIGDAPQTDSPAIARNEAHLALTKATCGHVPQQHWHKEPRGTLNGFIEWSRPSKSFLYTCNMDRVKKEEWKKPPEGRKHAYALRHYYKRPDYWTALPLDLIDEPSQFAAALHIRREGRALNGQSVPPCPVLFGMVDVTLRRLQKFKVEKGKEYRWKNVRVETGQLLQAGSARPDDRGLLTIPQVYVDRDILGNKLVIEPGGGGSLPKIDESQTVKLTYHNKINKKKFDTLELGYQEYAQRCRNPEMVKVARSGRAFLPKHFDNGPASGESYSMWGGGWDDAFEFSEAGRYRAEIKSTWAYFQCGAWPQYAFSVSKATRSIVHFDSAGPMSSFRWFDIPEPGRRRVGLRIVNGTFHEPFKHGDQSGMIDRGITLQSVTFVRLPERSKGGTKPFLARIRERGATLGVGMPLQFHADVLDEWGRPAAATAAWSASGGSISAGGLFRADKPGTYTISVKAGDKSDSIELTVAGDAWKERFNDQRDDGWNTVAVSGPPMRCEARRWLLDIRPAKKRQKSACLAYYAPGAPWTDYAFSADFGEGKRHYSYARTMALVFRYMDEDNYYRFERTRPRKGTPVCRLIKVVDGKETELARSAASIPAPLTLEGDAAVNHLVARWEFQKHDAEHRGVHFNKIEEKSRDSIRKKEEELWEKITDPWKKQFANAKASLKIHRYTVTVRGNSIVCSLNEKEVLTANDADLKQGTIGFFCQDGGVRWDNLVVKPLK